MALWWLNRGPVGGVLGASISVLASTFLPPTHPLEVSLSTSLASSSQCIKCIILSHLALPSRTVPCSHKPHTAQRHTNTQTHAQRHLVSEIRNLQHQRVRLLSPCYLAWTTWPWVQRGMREWKRSGNKSRTGEKERSGAKRKEKKGNVIKLQKMKRWKRKRDRWGQRGGEKKAEGHREIKKKGGGGSS